MIAARILASGFKATNAPQLKHYTIIRKTGSFKGLGLRYWIDGLIYTWKQRYHRWTLTNKTGTHVTPIIYIKSKQSKSNQNS